MISVRSSALGNQKLVNVSLANRSDVAMDIRDAQVLVTAKPGKVLLSTRTSRNELDCRLLL
jgi:hypothetical protein